MMKEYSKIFSSKKPPQQNLGFLSSLVKREVSTSSTPVIKNFKKVIIQKYTKDNEIDFTPSTVEELVDFLNMTTVNSNLKKLDLSKMAEVRNTKFCKLLLTEICKFSDLESCVIGPITTYGLTTDILNSILKNNKNLSNIEFCKGRLDEYKNTDPIADFMKKPNYTITQITYYPNHTGSSFSSYQHRVSNDYRNNGISGLNSSNHASQEAYRMHHGEDNKWDRFITPSNSLNQSGDCRGR